MKDEENRNLDEFLNDAEEAPSSIIFLTDEEGKEEPFEFLDLIPYEDGEYVVLLPADDQEDDEEEDMVVILKVEAGEDDETEAYISIEDERILQAVFDIFKERFADEFNFTD